MTPHPVRLSEFLRYVDGRDSGSFFPGLDLMPVSKRRKEFGPVHIDLGHQNEGHQTLWPTLQNPVSQGPMLLNLVKLTY